MDQYEDYQEKIAAEIANCAYAEVTMYRLFGYTDTQIHEDLDPWFGYTVVCQTLDELDSQAIRAAARYLLER